MVQKIDLSPRLIKDMLWISVPCAAELLLVAIRQSESPYDYLMGELPFGVFNVIIGVKLEEEPETVIRYLEKLIGRSGLTGLAIHLTDENIAKIIELAYAHGWCLKDIDDVLFRSYGEHNEDKEMLSKRRARSLKHVQNEDLKNVLESVKED